MWDPGAGIWQHNPAELSKFDTPVTLWQKRRENSKHLLAGLDRNLAIYKANENNQTPNPVWTAYVAWITEAKRLYAIHGLKWNWKLSDHVYREFN
jgi:hypothetical protein